MKPLKSNAATLPVDMFSAFDRAVDQADASRYRTIQRGEGLGPLDIYRIPTGKR